MPLRGLREMVVHSFYTLTILRGYEFAPPFLNNRSDPDDYVVVQMFLVLFIASFTDPLWTSVFILSHCVTLPVPGILGGLRTLKAAAVDTLFVIFFGL
jgi:hypothetical protein